MEYQPETLASDAGRGDAPDPVVTVDVCICTFRRPGVAATIASVAAQRGLADRWRLRIIVADNDMQPTAKETVRSACHAAGLTFRYVHAPAQNISIARNACLDAADADWIVFIDDDECARADWLERLFARAESRDIVFGISQAVMAQSGIPHWMRDGAVHSNTFAGNDAPHNGYTCNVLMRRTFIRQAGLRFDLAFGQTGGEDTVFFDDARNAGARFAFAPDAVVFEEIPHGRSSLRWLVRRRFRAGQTHHAVLRRNGQAGAAITGLAAMKAAWCALVAALFAFSPRRRSHALMRASLHAGCVSAALGSAAYQEYG